MNTKSLLCVSVLVVLLVAGWQLASAQAVRESAGQKWEYTVVGGGMETFPAKSAVDELSKLGGEGWELVAVEPRSVARNFADSSARVFYLKRLKE